MSRDWRQLVRVMLLLWIVVFPLIDTYAPGMYFLWKGLLGGVIVTFVDLLLRYLYRLE